MKNKKIKFFLIIVIILAIAGFIFVKSRSNKAPEEITLEINPKLGSIQTIISTTGTVLPKNRLEIKPPVNGRIESVLVQEGDNVKIGQTLAWMSSTERAALLDAARGQSEKELKYWEEAYKPIALLAPINGQVIVATTQPGQTVTTSDAVVVLSDHLIVRAQVDETDIGSIKPDQKATVTLDAYSETKINCTVEHIYYESQTVNNVTIYMVDLIPQEVPHFFRSGMNATVNFIQDSSENTLTLPLEAVHKEKDGHYVLLMKNGSKESVKQVVGVGVTDDKRIEITSGLDADSKVLIKIKKYALPTNNVGTNPFMPFRNRNKK